MVWRAHVQTDDVAHLVDELRVFADRERAFAMGLEAESPPNPTDSRLGKTGPLRHGAGTPMSGVVGL